MKMRFYVANCKMVKVQDLAMRLFLEFQSGRIWMRVKTLRHFCGMSISLALAMPWASFDTSALSWDMPARNQGMLEAAAD